MLGILEPEECCMMRFPENSKETLPVFSTGANTFGVLLVKLVNVIILGNHLWRGTVPHKIMTCGCAGTGSNNE